MDRRFSLILVVALLCGGAIMLWLNSQPPAPPPTVAPEVETSATAAEQEGTYGLFTLAISWQPGFCENETRKPECRSLDATRYDADHFTLHGLWPQDSYCDVDQRLIETDKSGRWSDLPVPALSAGTRNSLVKVMPGTQSSLDRHEWLVHGTCSGVSAESYYARAVKLLDTLNTSQLRDLFARNIGRRLSSSQIREAFERDFGKSAGTRLRVYCEDDGDRELITELRIRLYGDVMSDASISQLIKSATPAATGCSGGVVDPIGNQ